MMNYSQTPKLLCLGITLSASAQVAVGQNKEDKRPNILCITCEDISPILGCYGDKVAVSPNLDRFSESAVRLTQMHTTVGVSAPSRFALMTGLYPSSAGANYMRTMCERIKEMPAGILPYNVILPENAKCYTEYLREAGYYCTNNNKEDYQFNVPKSAWDDSSMKAHYRNRPEGMPFYAVFNLQVTHESQTWVRTNKPLSVDPADIEVPPYYPDNDIVRHDMAVAYSNVTEMDRQFQRLVDELEKSGEMENTIIIWYSDNGGPLPRQKRSIYESGTHVPFMISFPDGYRAGQTDDRLSMFVDIPATVLSLAGVKTPKHMHGQALFGEYTQSKNRKYIYAARDRMDECYDKQGAVSDGHLRYIRNYNPEQPNYMPVQYRTQMPLMRNLLELNAAGKLNKVQAQWFSLDRPAEELYDDVADPHNVHNLIDDPRYKADIERLSAEFDRWIERDNQRWLLSEQQSRLLMLPDVEQPQLEPVKIKLVGKKIKISAPEKCASIVYRIDGKGPSERGWYLYTAPIKNLKPGQRITALATCAGYTDSETASITFGECCKAAKFRR